MNFLEKIQNLPEQKRKVILWAVVVILGIGLLTFYIKNIQQKFKNIGKEELQKQLRLPELQEKLRQVPKFEIPF